MANNSLFFIDYFRQSIDTSFTGNSIVTALIIFAFMFVLISISNTNFYTKIALVLLIIAGLLDFFFPLAGLIYIGIIAATLIYLIIKKIII